MKPIVLRIKDYAILHDINRNTASVWYHQDCQMLKVRKITTAHLERIYGYTVEQITNKLPHLLSA